MAVRRSECQLAHPPRLVARLLQHLGVGRQSSAVEAVNIVNKKVRNVAVITQLASGRSIRAATKHEGDVA